MRSVRSTLTFSLMLFVCLFHTSLSGQKFKYTFEKGKIYHYETAVESKTSGQMGGQEFSVTSGAQFNYSISLTEKSESAIVLLANIEKFQIKLNMPMMGFKDSTIVMSDLVGKKIQVKITEQGKNISVTAIDTIKPSRLLMMTSVSPVDLFQRVFFEFPSKELDVQGSWKKTDPDTTKRGGMTMITKNNIDFVVLGKEKQNGLDCWKISVNGKSTVEGSGTQQGAEVTVDGLVKTTGTVYAAPAEGVFVGADQSTESDVTMTASGTQSGASTMMSSSKVQTRLVQ